MEVLYSSFTGLIFLVRYEYTFCLNLSWHWCDPLPPLIFLCILCAALLDVCSCYKQCVVLLYKNIQNSVQCEPCRCAPWTPPGWAESVWPLRYPERWALTRCCGWVHPVDPHSAQTNKRGRQRWTSPCRPQNIYKTMIFKPGRWCGHTRNKRDFILIYINSYTSGNCSMCKDTIGLQPFDSVFLY